MAIVLGLDLGTQYLKALAYDAERRAVLAITSAPLELHQHDDGTAEQQVQWWLSALRSALHQIDPKVRRSIRALAVSGQQHGFVPLDEAGEALAPVKLWCDTSTAAECDAIMATLGGVDACIEIVGNPIAPGYTASKVLGLKRHHPAAYAQLARILLPHDYLNHYLTGELCMEAGDASGTGFFDVRKRQWSSEVLAAIDDARDLQALLPPVRTRNEAIGGLLPAVAEDLGLPAGIPVAVGGGDNMMGAIGTANVAPGAMTVSLGTSGTVYACSDRPIIDPHGQIAAFCSSTGGWLPLLCTMNCTVSTELARSLLGFDLKRFEQEVAAAPPGAGGMLTLPFFNGERTPNLPNGKGCIVGVDAANAGAGNFLRSAMEGATFALKSGVAELAKLGIEAEDIVLIGGGAKSAAWRQMVADMFDLPVRVPVQEESAAFGAALQALDLIARESVEELAREHFEVDASLGCTPEPLAVNLYMEAYRQYRAAVAAVTPLYRP